jgi:hypothetical protein
MFRASINGRFILVLAFTTALGLGCGGSTPADNSDPNDDPPGNEGEGNETDHSESFTAVLQGSEAVPNPVTTDATGLAEFELSQDGQRLAFELTVSEIENAFAAHIHLGASGTTGEIAVYLYVGDAVSLTGVLAQGTITDADVVATAASSLDELLEVMRDGDAYVNVHTNAYPNGEIRGQIEPSDGS